ncbi:NAD-dependent epimerase/dehydratase [Punctularia strigosozonata HHB-11173 SS5]|uniref:NAD-dependent epimerase/dehydratase n=1 Tax=Punctularia strigosozonata (strain HHB-11173) TaxID=741275 RepID=UPI00044185F7|nr:NAD-dependent epimerase/dehydratase [Punctularia strigosozonata HHB-11173 SS5]EIN10185.1 NAD-dependent epimerase/dehydratase [Punctularia strigosozonata HHB-11173 SS5]
MTPTPTANPSLTLMHNQDGKLYLVCGGNGFIGVDVRVGNLCDPSFAHIVVDGVYCVLHFAANMGGMGTIHDRNDFAIYRENEITTLNLVEACLKAEVSLFFYASSACVYPENLQCEPGSDVSLRENDVWAHGRPTSQGLYGLQKLHAETWLLAKAKEFPEGVRIARFHNMYASPFLFMAVSTRRLISEDSFGPGGAWKGGREKAPAALLRKAYAAAEAGAVVTDIEIWGDGSQRRSFLYITDCCEAVMRLIDSEYAEPLNVGSEHSVSINELANIAMGCAGIDLPSRFVPERPLGVVSRNSNNDLIREILGWEPTTSLEDGMRETGKWIGGEIVKELSGMSAAERSAALRTMRHSEVVDLDKAITFAILLPITSRGSNPPSQCLDNLHDFGRSLSRTSWRDVHALGGMRYRVKIYLEIDAGDEFLRGSGARNRAEVVLRDLGFRDVFTLINDEHPKGHVCALWRDCARQAWIDGCDYMVLMGDDVIVDTEGWMRDAHATRWGCSKMFDCRIRNSVGGEGDARYVKEHAQGWTFETLDEGVAGAKRWLRGRTPPAQRKLTLDIVVPSYRVDIGTLSNILALQASPTCAVMFIIIVDDPASPATAVLRRRFEHRVDVRIRVNESNLGASASRNRGMLESAAEYILYVDDDVKPSSELLVEVERIIRAHPDAPGFVGNVKFPIANTVFKAAIHLAGVTYFWDIAEKITDDIPWGVTANLIARRVNDSVQYDLRFPKTGGGEDIDFCRKKRQWALERTPESCHFEGFVAAPRCVVTHPWWGNGERSYWRFYMWSKGDGALIGMYPELTYLAAAPNAAEMLLVSAIVILVGTVVAVESDKPTFLLLGFSMAAAVIAANVIHDLYRHLVRDADRVERMDTSLQGLKWVAAVMESTLIRIWSETGRIVGLLERCEVSLLMRRFDWFAGRYGSAPMIDENRNSTQRLLLVVLICSVLFARLA